MVHVTDAARAQLDKYFAGKDVSPIRIRLSGG